jgi:hypothetical protein
MAKITPWLLYPQGNNLCYQVVRRLAEPQSWSGCCGHEKILSPLLGIKPRLHSHPAHNPLLYWLSNCGSSSECRRVLNVSTVYRCNINWGGLCEQRYFIFRCWATLSPFVLWPQMDLLYHPLMVAEYTGLMTN